MKPPIDGVSLSGALLVSLLQEISASPAGSHGRPGVQRCEGFLYGELNQRVGTEIADAMESRAVTHHEVVLEGYKRTGERYSFYNGLGSLDTERLGELFASSSKEDGILAGFFVVRKAEACRPTVREMNVYLALADHPLVTGPFVLLLLTASLAPKRPTQSFQYQCIRISKVGGGGGGGSSSGGGSTSADRWASTSPKWRTLRCRIKNLTHDSAAEYGQFQPAPLPRMVVATVPVAALSEAFAEVPPLHVQAQEGLLNAAMTTLQGLVEGMRGVENEISRLQVQAECIAAAAAVVPGGARRLSSD